MAFADARDPSRTLTLRISERLRVLLVVTTEAADRTRISARRAKPAERALYEEG